MDKNIYQLADEAAEEINRQAEETQRELQRIADEADEAIRGDTMSKVYTITNQKGGAGKTTTALAVAAGLSLKGYSVLSIDLDAQSNMTYTAGAKADGATALGVLTGRSEPGTLYRRRRAGALFQPVKPLPERTLL